MTDSDEYCIVENPDKNESIESSQLVHLVDDNDDGIKQTLIQQPEGNNFKYDEKPNEPDIDPEGDNSSHERVEASNEPDNNKQEAKSETVTNVQNQTGKDPINIELSTDSAKKNDSPGHEEPPVITEQAKTGTTLYNNSVYNEPPEQEAKSETGTTVHNKDSVHNEPSEQEAKFETGTTVNNKDSVHNEPSTDTVHNKDSVYNEPLKQEAKSETSTVQNKDSVHNEPSTAPTDLPVEKNDSPELPIIRSVHKSNFTANQVKNMDKRLKQKLKSKTGTDVHIHKDPIHDETSEKEQIPISAFNDNITLSLSNLSDLNTDRFSNLDKQQIRKRKGSIKRQEESPSPSNNNVRRTNDSNYQFKHIVGLIIIVVFAFVLPYSVPNLKQLIIKPSLIQKFADETVKIFDEFNNVELPDVSNVMDHAITCRRASNTFLRSVVFKSYGSDIAAGLRDFGETTKDAGDLLRELYSKHSSIYTLFDTEIEAMIHRLNLDSRKSDDAKYIKERLNRLLTKVKGLRQLVEKTRRRILDVGSIKRKINNNVERGFKEAEKYTDKEKYLSEINRAKKELANVENILIQLNGIAGQLEKLGKTLKYYEDKLKDVSDSINIEENDGDGVFKITKNDVQYLEKAIDNSKASYKKFNRLLISD